MAFAWTPPAVLHGVTPTPGLKTPVVSEVRIAVVMLAGSNDGLLAQSSVARRLPPAADSAPGVVAREVSPTGAEQPPSTPARRLIASAAHPVSNMMDHCDSEEHS